MNRKLASVSEHVASSTQQGAKMAPAPAGRDGCGGVAL